MILLKMYYFKEARIYFYYSKKMNHRHEVFVLCKNVYKLYNNYERT